MKQSESYELARLVVQTLGSDSDKQKALARFGFERKDAQNGKAILNKIDQLSDEQQQQSGAKIQSTKDLTLVRKQAHSVYIRHITLARLVFTDEVEQRRILRLDEPRQDAFAGWLEQATTFYRNAPSFVDKLSEVGLKLEDLQQAEAQVQTVAQLRVKQSGLVSDTQRLAKQRTAAYRELEKWLQDFRYVARFAFRDDPQQLEAFGMVVA